ncbi:MULTISPECIES: hypothetical protein [Bacillus cereus group]|uniref:hypothetical protein n=1 Tax=Bacillus cereus group TaxID=86661 RepID=UPI0021D25093|nr:MULTISPECIES: hypothetical protein [Bacillus cereus group]MCU5201627.1 hypothetical protein [Bacillus paranthracis]MCU5374707.1 hypothetical protein [Bacillus pacificus]
MSEEEKKLVNPVSLPEEKRDVIRKFIERSKLFPGLIVKEIEVEEKYKYVKRFTDEMTHPIMKNELIDNIILMRFYSELGLMGLRMFPWGYFKFLEFQVKALGLGLWEITRMYGTQTRKTNDNRFPNSHTDRREEMETYYFMVKIKEDGTKPHVRVYMEENEDKKNDLQDEWMQRVEEKEQYELVVREYTIQFYRYFDEFFDMHSKFNLGDNVKLSSIEKYLNFTKDFLKEVRFYLKFMYFCYEKVDEFQYFCFEQNMTYCEKEIERGLKLIQEKRDDLKKDAKELGRIVTQEEIDELVYISNEFYDYLLLKNIHNPYKEVHEFNKSFFCPRKMNIKNEKEIEDLITLYGKPVNESGYMFVFIENGEVTLCPSLGELIRTESFSGDSQTSDDWQRAQLRNIKDYVKNKPNFVQKIEKTREMTKGIRTNWEVKQQSIVAPQLKQIEKTEE